MSYAVVFPKGWKPWLGPLEDAYHADSTEPYAQARCQTDGRRCGWVAQFAQSLRWR